MSDARRGALLTWATAEAAVIWPAAMAAEQLSVVSGDASFRRYFRLALTGEGPASLIAVDAPPATEDSAAFVALSALLLAAGVRAPRVLAVDLAAGWMLLEDLGDRLLLPALLEAQANEGEATRLYAPAFDALVRLQSGVAADALPPFDEAKLLAEMTLFESWFCRELLEIELSSSDTERLRSTFAFLAEAALSQPQVAVHRDYHSRNLMLLDKGGLGVIDFQDAVRGAYTYDLVSLLRDCYVSWPQPLVADWLQQFYGQLVAAQPAASWPSFAQFTRDFDLMGLQRHLKVLGIFSRLHLRDNKSAYLADIPLVMNYFSTVACQYPELDSFSAWFDAVVVPQAQRVLTAVARHVDETS